MKPQEKKLIEAGIEFLWELREYMHNNGFKAKHIGWVDDTIEDVEILGLGKEPDSGYSQEVKKQLDSGELNPYSLEESMNEIMVRIHNANPF